MGSPENAAAALPRPSVRAVASGARAGEMGRNVDGAGTLRSMSGMRWMRLPIRSEAASSRLWVGSTEMTCRSGRDGEPSGSVRDKSMSSPPTGGTEASVARASRRRCSFGGGEHAHLARSGSGGPGARSPSFHPGCSGSACCEG